MDIVFYSADTDMLVPNEHFLVKDLINRVHREPHMNNVQFIVRIHPYERNRARWQSIKEMPGVSFTSPWQTEDKGSWGNISERDIHLLTGSLKHSICNLNISSTMALDAIFCDRPVIAPAYDVVKARFSSRIRNLYMREFYLPITNSGAINIVESPEAAVNAIKAVQKNPSNRHVARLMLKEKMLGKPIGQSADSIIDAIEQISLMQGIKKG
jgi:hypothetical protein